MVSAANFQLGRAEQFLLSSVKSTKALLPKGYAPVQTIAGAWLASSSANHGLNVFTNMRTKPRGCQTTQHTALAAAAPAAEHTSILATGSCPCPEHLPGIYAPLTICAQHPGSAELRAALPLVPSGGVQGVHREGCSLTLLTSLPKANAVFLLGALL